MKSQGCGKSLIDLDWLYQQEKIDLQEVVVDNISS